MRHLHLILGLASLVAAALAMTDVRAAVVATRAIQANATSYCQTALPVFDANVRKRPLAVQNEGTGDVFVTCSFTAQATPLYSVTLYLANTGTGQVTVSCTGVTGRRGQANEYVTKTTFVPPLNNYGQLIWDGEDFAGMPPTIPGGGLFSVSCKLPPGIGIGNSYIVLFEDVGN